MHANHHDVIFPFVYNLTLIGTKPVSNPIIGTVGQSISAAKRPPVGTQSKSKKTQSKFDYNSKKTNFHALVANKTKHWVKPACRRTVDTHDQATHRGIKGSYYKFLREIYRRCNQIQFHKLSFSTTHTKS